MKLFYPLISVYRKNKNFLFFLPILGLLIMMGCQNKSTRKIATKEKTEENQYLRKLEDTALSLQAKADQATDYPLAQSLVDESLDFAKHVKTSDHLPAVLFRAGEVARSIKQYEQAVGIFSRIHMNYPKTPLAIKALFLEANTFEDGIKDKQQAKLRYQHLIELYPDDLLADQARLLLKNIDKSPEELIREFEKNK